MVAGPLEGMTMKRTIMILILSVLITIMFSACGEEEIMLQEVSGDTGSVSEEIVAAEASPGTDKVRTEQAAESDSTSAACVYVYVCGEVATPGVYELMQGARIYEAVQLAGGLTEDADPSVINQAEPVTDGMMIRIPARGSEEAAQAASVQTGQQIASDGTVLIDINTADAATLMMLPGIGESKAAAIIAWREENGGFAVKEDLKNVSGIGDSTYERLSPQITVTP